jgi:DNA-binding transcriptional MerR regulator
VNGEQALYNADELADLGGVTRRTVRYYVQEGLIPAPLGVGRGRHYSRAHLDRLLEVKAQQEAGLTLDDIRARRAPRPGGGEPRPATARLLPRSAWRRFELAPGVELHVASDIRLPAPGRLEELVEWCQVHLSRTTEGEG